MAHSTPRPPRDPEWKRLLTPMARARAAEEELGALGVSFELFADDSRGWFYDSAPVPLERARLEDGGDWFVGIRPLEAGSRAGTWRRGGLTWRSFAHPGGGSQRPVRALLDQLYRLSRDERNLNPGEAGLIRLDRYPSTLLWTLLERLHAAGVALVGGGLVTGVRLGARADKRMDLRKDRHGRLHLEPRLRIDGEGMAASAAVGDHGFAGLVGDLSQVGGALALVLAPVESRPVPGAEGLMRRREPLVVAAADVEEFTEEFYPVLRAAVAVTSEDGSAELPDEAPPRLSLLVEYGEEDEAVLHWSWLYRGPRREYAVTSGTSTGGTGASRDPAAEAAVAARAGRLWPGAGEMDRQDLSGTDTAVFTVRVLPELERLDCVEVRISGERRDYRELTEPPTVRVTSEESGTRDWFDLAFEVTVAGRTVAFAPLFRALVEGRKHLLLPDKSLLKLDHPAFDRLKELIAEAEAVGEWDPEAPKISRYQVDLWEEFVDVADSSQAAVAWRESVAALRSLGSLPRPEPPAGLRARLREYQLDGYAWLSLLHDHELGGILADDMGLGKTLQALAMIVRAREGGAGMPPFLVVAPSSVMGVWAAEAERFAPSLDVRVIDGTRTSRRTRIADEATDVDVIVTSYALLRLDAEEYRSVPWSGLLMDEAQFARNRRTQVHQALAEIEAPFRLAITGTPMENSLDDLWALLSLTAPGLFPSPVAFREQYTLPVEKGGARRRLARLRRRIRPFVLRRTKENVVAELPGKQEQVLGVDLLPEHRRLYDAVLQRERKKVLGLLDDLERQGMERARFIVFRSLTLLRMLALDPAIVDAGEHAGVESSKLRMMLEELDQVLAERHRVLIFSQFTSFLDRVGEALDERGIEYARLDGTTRRRTEVVSGFRSGEAGVFLLSLKAGGFGLTLTEADYVYLMDPWWNPAAEAQAIDRSHRIGQSSPVMVYRLVARGTIEEKVLDLQRRKSELAAELLDGAEAGEGQADAGVPDDEGARTTDLAQTLTAQDLRALFEDE